MKAIGIIGAVLLSASMVQAQGLVDGYFKGKGKLDVAISASYQSTSKYFAGNKEIHFNRQTTSFGVFGEYGITEKWDVIANVPFINTGFQDMGLFTKYELIDKKIGEAGKLSVIPAIGVFFPLSNYNTESSQAIGQRATQIQPKLVVQWNIGNGMFIQAQSGYNYAFEPNRPSLPASIKWGYSFGKNYIDVWYDHQTGFGDKDYLGSVPYDSFREFVVSYDRIGGVFYRTLGKKWGAFVNGAYTIGGRNTAKGPVFGAGVVLKFF